MKKCPCGKKLHYSSLSLQKIMEEMCTENGEFIRVTVIETGKTYLVSRHFIALHGIAGSEMDSYGFEEVV
jgi:hypothetical protein